MKIIHKNCRMKMVDMETFMFNLIRLDEPLLDPIRSHRS